MSDVNETVTEVEEEVTEETVDETEEVTIETETESESETEEQEEETGSYTVTLADGAELSGLFLNGNNFISKTEIDESVFEDNLSSVTIYDGEYTTTLTNCELVQLKQYDDEYWFIIRQYTEAELEKFKMESDIEYIAMMADIEL